MSAQLAVATKLAMREQARRPLLIVLLVGLPFFFITRAIAATEKLPRRIGLPGDLTFLTDMRALHGASMVAITVAFLSGLCGAFVMRSARASDRRLVVAGYSATQTIFARTAVLAAACVLAVSTSLAVTALSFTPQSWGFFALGSLLVAVIYASIGALAGALLGQLSATYLVLFAAMLGTGILQNPMFGDGTPSGVATLLPDYGPTRVIADAAFEPGFAAWPQLALALAWAVGLGGAVLVVLRRSLKSRA